MTTDCKWQGCQKLLRQFKKNFGEDKKEGTNNTVDFCDHGGNNFTLTLKKGLRRAKLMYCYGRCVHLYINMPWWVRSKNDRFKSKIVSVLNLEAEPIYDLKDLLSNREKTEFGFFTRWAYFLAWGDQYSLEKFRLNDIEE